MNGHASKYVTIEWMLRMCSGQESARCPAATEGTSVLPLTALTLRSRQIQMFPSLVASAASDSTWSMYVSLGVMSYSRFSVMLTTVKAKFEVLHHDTAFHFSREVGLS